MTATHVTDQKAYKKILHDGYIRPLSALSSPDEISPGFGSHWMSGDSDCIFLSISEIYQELLAGLLKEGAFVFTFNLDQLLDEFDASVGLDCQSAYEDLLSESIVETCVKLNLEDYGPEFQLYIATLLDNDYETDPIAQSVHKGFKKRVRHYHQKHRFKGEAAKEVVSKSPKIDLNIFTSLEVIVPHALPISSAVWHGQIYEYWETSDLR